MLWIRRKTFIISLGAVVNCTGLSLSARGDCPRYKVEATISAPCNQSYTWTFGGNTSGAFAGYYGCPSLYYYHPFYWTTNTGFVIIPSLPGMSQGLAAAIADAGIVVGTMWNDSTQRAFKYERGVVTDLGTLPNDNYASAISLNDAVPASIVGASGNSSTTPQRACLWTNGEVANLNTPIGPASVALDINDKQQIVGWMGVTPNPLYPAYPFLWEDGVTTNLGYPVNGLSASANAINNKGEVCGFYNYPNPNGNGYRSGALLWKNAEVIELGMLSCQFCQNSGATDVNDLGQIVGGSGSEAFLWQDDVMYQLDTLIPPGSGLMRIDVATGINNQGQIVASATDLSFLPVAVLLSPIPPVPGDVNCDQHVNTADLLGVINHWHDTSGTADLNHDGIVSAPDIVIVIQNWGQ